MYTSHHSQVHSESKPQQFLNQVAQLPALEVLLYHNGHFRTTSAVVLPPPLIERGMLRCLDLHFHAHELDLYGTDLAPMASSLTELRLTNAMVGGCFSGCVVGELWMWAPHM